MKKKFEALRFRVAPMLVWRTNTIGEIVNISADESILGEDDIIDVSQLRPIAFEPVRNSYHILGERVGNAFKDGAALK